MNLTKPKVLAKEFLLLLAATVGIQLALGASDLADALKTSEAPLETVKAWASAFWLAALSTVIKQAAVWGLTKFGMTA